jgi:hypothetical protein
MASYERHDSYTAMYKVTDITSDYALNKPPKALHVASDVLLIGTQSEAFFRGIVAEQVTFKYGMLKVDEAPTIITGNDVRKYTIYYPNDYSGILSNDEYVDVEILILTPNDWYIQVSNLYDCIDDHLLVKYVHRAFMRQVPMQFLVL